MRSRVEKKYGMGISTISLTNYIEPGSSLQIFPPEAIIVLGKASLTL
jgi:hypothetical protein